MSGGFGNAAGAEQEQQKSEAGRSEAFLYEVWPLYPNEVMTARFYGGKGEPYTFSKHGFSRGSTGGYPSAICARAEHGICEACGPANRRGEKRVKRASPVAAFKLFSTRIVMKLPEQKADGTIGVKREVIHVDENGQHLQKIQVQQPNGQKVTTFGVYPGGKHPHADALAAGQIEWEYEGPRIWRGSLSPIANNATEILLLDKKLSRRCKCGQVAGQAHEKAPAVIITTGNLCTNCGNAVAYNEDSRERNEATTCPACHTAMRPKEVLGCSANCGNPTRGSLPDCYVRISRKGESTETRYSFEPMPFSQISDIHMGAMFPPDEKTGQPTTPSFDYKVIYKANPEEIRALLMERGIMPQGGNAFGGAQGGFPQQNMQQQGFGPQGGQPANPFAQQSQSYAPTHTPPAAQGAMPSMGGFAPPPQASALGAQVSAAPMVPPVVPQTAAVAPPPSVGTPSLKW